MSNDFLGVDATIAKVIFERGYPQTEDEFYDMVDERVRRLGEIIVNGVVAEISGGTHLQMPFERKPR